MLRTVAVALFAFAVLGTVAQLQAKLATGQQQQATTKSLDMPGNILYSNNMFESDKSAYGEEEEPAINMIYKHNQYNYYSSNNDNNNSNNKTGNKKKNGNNSNKNYSNKNVNNSNKNYHNNSNKNDNNKNKKQHNYNYNYQNNNYNHENNSYNQQNNNNNHPNNNNKHQTNNNNHQNNNHKRQNNNYNHENNNKQQIINDNHQNSNYNHQNNKNNHQNINYSHQNNNYNHANNNNNHQNNNNNHQNNNYNHQNDNYNHQNNNNNHQNNNYNHKNNNYNHENNNYNHENNNYNHHNNNYHNNNDKKNNKFQLDAINHKQRLPLQQEPNQVPNKSVGTGLRATELRHTIPPTTATITTTATTTARTKVKPPTSIVAAAAPLTPSTKFYHHPNSFVNPFGQLGALFGSDQLHLEDYNFLFNAARHTVFQLHTNAAPAMPANTVTSGSLLDVANDSLGAAFGVSGAAAAAAGRAGGSTTQLEEVQLYNAASLRQSRFNPFNPTRILIHGWFGGLHANVYNALIPEYLSLGSGNYNVFTVDWGRGAIADYITASYRVKPVGKVVAKFIDFLHRESGMRYADLHVVGFSMGAHIAGIAGKYVQTGRLAVIYGLDPALPLFRYENIEERLSLADADYVEVIHTSAGTYGYDWPLGHVDFYVNYGSNQPGCFFLECSHFRAYQVFAESLHAKEGFRGQGCDVQLWQDLSKARRCLMGTGRNLTMGGDPLNAAALKGRGGVYYLPTNANAPYARG